LRTVQVWYMQICYTEFDKLADGKSSELGHTMQLQSTMQWKSCPTVREIV